MARTRRPVSLPGGMSSRTDLTAAGSTGQPIRTATGQAYGEAGRQQDLQRAAPMAAGASPGGAPGTATPAGAAGPSLNVFGPTMRPGEPLTEGAPVGPGGMGPLDQEGMDIDRLLQVMYSIVPSPAIARLMIRPYQQE